MHVPVGSVQAVTTVKLKCGSIPSVQGRFLALSAFLHSRAQQTGVDICASEGFSAKQGHLRERGGGGG